MNTLRTLPWDMIGAIAAALAFIGVIIAVVVATSYSHSAGRCPTESTCKGKQDSKGQCIPTQQHRSPCQCKNDNSVFIKTTGTCPPKKACQSRTSTGKCQCKHGYAGNPYVHPGDPGGCKKCPGKSIPSTYGKDTTKCICTNSYGPPPPPGGISDTDPLQALYCTIPNNGHGCPVGKGMQCVGTCLSAWRGDNCETSACVHGQPYGDGNKTTKKAPTANAYGTCACESGWGDEHCDRKSIQPPDTKNICANYTKANQELPLTHCFGGPYRGNPATCNKNAIYMNDQCYNAKPNADGTLPPHWQNTRCGPAQTYVEDDRLAKCATCKGPDCLRAS